MLTFNTFGDTPDPATLPLVIAHGLFGSARNWGVIARRLGAGRRVIVPDMRNHGSSPWFDSHSYADMAGDLAELIAAQAGGQADVLGHSMGGKAAMVLALGQPGMVRKLVVADIAPVGYGHSQAHLIAAMRRVDVQAVQSRAEAAEMLGIDDPGVAAFLLQSLDLKDKRWKLNLDVLEAGMAGTLGFPEVQGRFDGPAFFLSGAESTYVLPEHHAPIMGLFPNAEFASIPGAGHWLHAEKPRQFEAALRGFLG